MSASCLLLLVLRMLVLRLLLLLLHLLLLLLLAAAAAHTARYEVGCCSEVARSRARIGMRKHINAKRFIPSSS